MGQCSGMTPGDKAPNWMARFRARPSSLPGDIASFHPVGTSRTDGRRCLITRIQAAPRREGRDMTETQPNIVFFYWDNFGWGELGCYGGGVLRGSPTPRIDGLAAEGLQLLNFNVEAQ